MRATDAPSSPPFQRLLVANRGEIALRVVRTCRTLGIEAVVAHSSVDRDTPAVALADRAVQIGPAPAQRSYLDLAAVMAAAEVTGCDALHPGYGFLSEDPDLAAACEDEGVTFVGPAAHVLARLGDKSVARATMAAAGLPLLPGSTGPVSTVGEAARAADEAGYPVIVKAVSGGGGRGMHVVTTPAELPAAYARARADAAAIFGDSRVFLERFLTHPRHVEVQVLCDQHGNALHLGERDCTAQRRHQKLVEETPAPGLDTALLDGLRAAAVRGALAVGLVGVGTFEFLVDPAGESFFLEVNGRIQVEHPVTEMVTGVDLVAEQILVAAGVQLQATQADVVPRGAAIECRVNAEDPDRGFAPAPGVLSRFVVPGGPFVRVDGYAEPGLRIPAAYDPLVAKLVAWGPDRGTAIQRMRTCLAELQVEGQGVRTNRDFLLEILDDDSFRAATHSIRLVDDMTGCREADGTATA